MSRHRRRRCKQRYVLGDVGFPPNLNGESGEQNVEVVGHKLNGMFAALSCLFASGYPKEERESSRPGREPKTGIHVVVDRPALYVLVVGPRHGALTLLRCLVQCRLLSLAMSPF